MPRANYRNKQSNQAGYSYLLYFPVVGATSEMGKRPHPIMRLTVSPQVFLQQFWNVSSSKCFFSIILCCIGISKRTSFRQLLYMEVYTRRQVKLGYTQSEQSKQRGTSLQMQSFSFLSFFFFILVLNLLVLFWGRPWILFLFWFVFVFLQSRQFGFQLFQIIFFSLGQGGQFGIGYRG